MNRISPIAIRGAFLLAVGMLLTPLLATAEPISTEDSLSLPSDTTPQKQETADALALFKARDYDGSLKLWQEAVKKNPEMPPAQVIMAQLYAQANMPKESEKALEQAAQEAPNDPETPMLLASLAMRGGDLAKAESLLQKASGLVSAFGKSPQRKESLQVRLYGSQAAVAEARKDWPVAQKALEELSKRDPKNSAAVQRAAYCMIQQKNPEGALARLREAAKADPAMLTPEVLLAQLYQRSGDRDNVKKWMAAAVTTAPKNLKTRLAAGYAALEIGQMDEAQKHATAASQIDPKSFDAKFLRGLIALILKDYQAGELYFDSALRQSPDDFATSNNLALALIEQNDEAKGKRAVEYAAANAKKYPQSASAASTYGWALYKTGKLDEAEKALRTAAALGPRSVDTAYYTARVWVDRGRKDEARQMLETALKQTGLSMCRQEAVELLEQLKK
jgi:cellulose synthase operon protein C